MPRYQQMEEGTLDEAQRRVWIECKSGPRGSVPPPVHVWLTSPGLADNAHKLGAYVRFGTGFSQKQTEIAILVTARYWTAQFEWAAHVRLALAAGVPQDVIDAIGERRAPHFTDPDDQLVYDFCHDFYEDHRVSDATYERVVARWGKKGAVDLAGLIGYYSFVSVTLNTFEVPTPPGAKLLEE
jgi:4-carboxymuconolactone decarboxylase